MIGNEDPVTDIDVRHRVEVAAVIDEYTGTQTKHASPLDHLTAVDERLGTSPHTRSPKRTSAENRGQKRAVGQRHHGRLPHLEHSPEDVVGYVSSPTSHEQNLSCAH